MRFFICLILAFGSLQAMSKGPGLGIGVRTIEYSDPERKRPMVVELWYPAKQIGAIDEPADFYWVHPREIRNAPMIEGKFPLIVISHGLGGDRRNHTWLADALVKRGFIVAAVDHHGNSRKAYNALISLRFWERPRDISFVLDQLLDDSFLKNRIAAEKIGFVGYSLGGMTGLSLAGAKAQNVKAVVKAQQANYKQIDPELLEMVDFSEGENDFADSRIKAIALLSPATFIFPPHALETLRAPVALVASEHDEVLPYQEHALQIIKHAAPVKLKIFKDNISHYAFLNRVSEEGKKVMEKEFQKESIEADRLKVHKEVAQFVGDFFRDQLR